MSYFEGKVKFLAIFLCVIIVDGESWRHKTLDADERYHLYWMVNGNTIIFQVEVRTTGWIAFGISPNGGMSGSDVVIGWVSNGKTTFHDRYARGKEMPTIDGHQDWKLLWSKENGTHTTIRFQRELNTCDKEEDLAVEGPTTRLIYAYSDKDPVSPNSVMYHGPENRGSKSLNLLQEGMDEENLVHTEDVLQWEIRSANVAVPHDIDTAYYCSIAKRPHLDRLHHITKIEAVIQPGNERFVHHMVLFECTNGNETKIEPLTKGYHECYDEDQSPNFAYCLTIITGWAVGGGPVYLPPNTGFPFGKSNAVYYVLEVHYDNTGYVQGIVDNSGLRITYTPKLRKYDSGVMIIGNLWYPCIFIPPRQKGFTVSGHGHPSCLKQGIPPDGIKVFGLLLHTHVAGIKVKVRHFRGRQELRPLASDENYDFNYQSYFTVPTEVRVLPDDHIIVECNYDTSNRENTTFGGLSTQQEMCLVFLFHYPEIQIALSVSCPSPMNLVKPLGVSDMSDDDRFVISPITGKNESFIDFLNTYPWDDNSVRAVQKAMKFSPQLNMCSERGGKLKYVFVLSRYPEGRNAYREPDKCALR